MVRFLPVIFWALLGALFFVPFLGNVHLFDWDEINFAEIAREMIITGNYGEPQINYIPFTEKPPLFFWLQALSMKVFGINEFAARFPNAFLGIMVLPLLYALGKNLYDARMGYLWALCYFGALLPHLYFKSGIIDPVFNLFIFLSLYCVIAQTKRKAANSNLGWLILGGAAAGIAILAKGPVALLIIGLVLFVYWLLNRFRFFITIPQFLLYLLSALIVTGLWFSINYLENGPDFIRAFTIRQWELFSKPDAGHKGFLLYHFVVLYFGCFPASTFLIRSLYSKTGEPGLFPKWMKILFWVVLLLFTIVTTKIAHYSSLAYYPISFLAALCIHKIANNEWQLDRWMKISLVFSAIPFILAPVLLAYFGQHIDTLKDLAKDDVFTYQSLNAQVNWSGWEFLPGLLLLMILVISLRSLSRNMTIKAVNLLFFGSAVYVQLAVFFLVGRIESYSQAAAIDFWKSRRGQDAYLSAYGYKSYAPLFYGEVMPHQRKNYLQDDWHLGNEIDKPVYLAVRANHKEMFEKRVPDARLLYNKNGFYFYERRALR